MIGRETQSKSKNGDAERPRTGRPFHRPSKAARGRFRAIAQSKGFAEPDVLLRWAEAVGPALSGLCRPVKVSYGGAVGATLLVRTDGAHAPEVEHSKMRIIERINAFYGYRAISRIRITQAIGSEGFREERPAFAFAPAPAREPPRAAVEEAAALAENIEDPGLRAAVSRMGAWVLSGSERSANDRERLS